MPPPAIAAWRFSGAAVVPPPYNQGIAFDRATRSLFFSGVTSTTNSGLYRTSAALRPSAARPTAIPRTPQRYNHIGDVAFDAARRRLLLPLECYYPRAGGNTCRRGAIGVADPRTLRFLYKVDFDAAQVLKLMWAEVSPDGRWILTSRGTQLLAYPAAQVNRDVAARQRAGTASGIVGRDLGPVLPPGGVSGGAVHGPSADGAYRLLVSVNRGTFFQVVSLPMRTGPDSSPVVAGPTRVEITLRRSSANDEPEGLGLTGGPGTGLPLRLRWQMVSFASLTARLRSYAWVVG